LLDTVVFGKIAGESASQFVKGMAHGLSGDSFLLENALSLQKRIEEWSTRDSGIKVHNLLNRLKVVMSEKVGLFRNRKDLAAALESIRQIRDDYQKAYLSGRCRRFSQELVNVLEFDQMLDLTEVITVGGLNREETRGSHYRLDFPERNDRDWLKHTLITRKDEKPEISYRAVAIGKYKPEARKY
jgi:succinate dehydrogenase / fumarate reductase flavoprotein subunit